MPISDTAKPRRIVLAITELDVGGAETCLANLALGLDRERFEPLVCALAERPHPDRAALVERLEAASIPVHFLGARSVWQFLSARRQAELLLRSLQPDILQSFLFHANVLFPTAARRAGVPHVLTGIRVADPAGWRLQAERFAARQVDQIVCVSHAVAQFVRDRGGFPPEKLQVIPNGLDLARFPAEKPADSSQLGIPPGRRLLISIGRLHRQKGLDWLLEFATDLLARTPQHDLLLVGDGPQRRALEEQARSLGIARRVHFVGWRPDIPQLLAASDILLLPSRWEGMPNVLLEAMASGLPVVASQVEGVVEILGPLAANQGVPVNDRESFIATTERLANCAELREQVGTENRNRIAAEFSLAGMIARYESLYTSLGGSKPLD